MSAAVRCHAVLFQRHLGSFSVQFGLLKSNWRAMSSTSNAQGSQAAHGNSDARSHVKSFADLKPFIRQFIRRVHPDTVHAQSDAVRAQNHEGMLLLDGMLDAVRHRCEACHKPQDRGTAALPVLEPSYSFKFHWLEDRGDASGSVLRDVTYVARMPSTLDAQTRLVADKAIASPTMHAQWLSVATTHVGHLLKGVGIVTRLSVDHSNEVGQRKKRLMEQRPQQPPSAERLLRENLVQWSPLQQGKVDAFPGPRPLDVTGSVFSEKVRVARVARIYSLGKITGDDTGSITPAALSVGLAAFTDFLVRYYERYYLYSDVWFSISVRLGRMYTFVPSTRTLYIPAKFNRDELAAFLDEHVPGILAEATDRAREGAAGRRSDRQQRHEARPQTPRQ